MAKKRKVTQLEINEFKNKLTLPKMNGIDLEILNEISYSERKSLVLRNVDVLGEIYNVSKAIIDNCENEKELFNVIGNFGDTRDVISIILGIPKWSSNEEFKQALDAQI